MAMAAIKTGLVALRAIGVAIRGTVNQIDEGCKKIDEGAKVAGDVIAKVKAVNSAADRLCKRYDDLKPRIQQFEKSTNVMARSAAISVNNILANACRANRELMNELSSSDVNLKKVVSTAKKLCAVNRQVKTALNRFK